MLSGRFHPYFNILLETVFLTAFYGFMRSTGSCVLRVHAFYGFTRSRVLRVYAFCGFARLRVLRVYAFYGFTRLRVHAFYGFTRDTGLRVYAFLRSCANAYTSPTQTFSPTRGLTFADVTFSARHLLSKSDSLGAAVTIIISRINNSLSLRFHVPLSQASAMHVPESPVYLRPANASRVVQSPSRDGGRRVRPTISPLHSVAPPWGGEGWLLPPQNHSLPPHLPPLRQFLLCIFI